MLDLPSVKDGATNIRDWYFQSFSAYGLRFRLRANGAAAFEAACVAVPYGWQPAPPGQADRQYSLAAPNQNGEYQLHCGSELIAQGPELAPVLLALNKHAELLTATQSRNGLFVHAGVVGWGDQAIVIPGRSFSGKTTLVKALVEAGATYYSDEFAIFDRQGLVHPYALPLSLRDAQGRPAGQIPAAALGIQSEGEPLPVGLVLVTQYQAGARWRPQRISAAAALLALMDNAVAAQGDPAHSMPILRQVALAATSLRGKRGEASSAARMILRRLSA